MKALKLAAGLFFAVVIFGCKPPKPGDKCTGNVAVCGDKTTALACINGTYVSMGCRGPLGCVKAGSAAVTCDDTVAQLGDGCDEENEVACSTDKKAALECHSNKFVVGETCKGPKACVVNGEKITCDNDISDQGDPCHFDGDFACSTDKTMAFKCINKVMTPLNSCRGAHGCRVLELPVEKKIEFLCDDSIATVGDPCDEEGEHACAMDKRSILVCKGTKFTPLKNCDGPKGCGFDDKAEHFTCDEVKSGTGKPVDVKGQLTPQPHKPGK